MAHPQIIMKDEALPSATVVKPLDLVNPYEMQTVKIEHRGEQTIYHYAQAVAPILNDNERERIEGHNDRGEFRKAASIPMVVWNLWESMGIVNDQRELRKAIERHKNEYKTTEKRLI